jgi:hypothetical protein
MTITDSEKQKLYALGYSEDTIALNADQLREVLGSTDARPAKVRTAARPEDALFKAVTEKELKRNFEQTAKQTGWRCYHTFISMYSTDGYPDETLTRKFRTVWVELKTMKGVVKPKQVEWLDALSDNPHNECFLIRPNQMDLVIKILTSEQPYIGPERWTRNNHFGV